MCLLLTVDVFIKAAGDFGIEVVEGLVLVAVGSIVVEGGHNIECPREAFVHHLKSEDVQHYLLLKALFMHI